MCAAIQRQSGEIMTYESADVDNGDLKIFENPLVDKVPLQYR